MNQDERGRVLIIDDNPMNLQALLLYLENAGYDILIATSGKQALKQLPRSHPDLILLDVLMPEMNGFETCRRLKSNEQTKDIPVIFMTALTDTVNKIQGFEAGGVDYVTKPLQHEEVLARINAHFTIRKLQQQLQQQNVLLEEQNTQLELEVSERKRAEGALRRYNDELSLLQDMGDLLQTCRSEEETYQVVINTCEHLLGTDDGCLCLVDEAEQHLYVVGEWGKRRIAPHLVQDIPSEQSDAGTVHVIERTKNTPLYLSVNPSVKLSVPYPLRHTSGEILGVLIFCPADGDDQDTQSALPESKQRSLSRVTEHYALVLGNLRLRETLKMEAIHDPLTGLYNRRHMEAFLDREVKLTERRNTDIGFMMVDIDHFKHINDSFGHDAGDAVLRQLGEILLNNIRGSDIACRYGGEEFLLIMPEVKTAVARQRAEELRHRIEHFSIPYQGTSIRITISIGVAAIPEHGSEVANVIQSADSALYQAKTEGRNRVKLASTKLTEH